jgi:hypothetical protein
VRRSVVELGGVRRRRSVEECGRVRRSEEE